MVASAEGDRRPHIHIWNVNTLETKNIIELDHIHTVSHLAFAQQQPLLAVATKRKKSPVLLFETLTWTLRTSFTHVEIVSQLAPFAFNIPKQQVPLHLQSYFIMSGEHKLSVVDESGVQCSSEYDGKITSLAVSYMNASFPYLRYLHADNLKLFVVTGHETG